MTRTSGNVRPAVVRPALVGMTTALFLVSSAIIAACGYRVTAPDFPVLKLTPVEPATATAAAEAKSGAAVISLLLGRPLGGRQA